MSVWCNQKYSLMLPSGAVVSKNLLWVDSGRTIANSGSSIESSAGSDTNFQPMLTQDISAELTLLLNILHENPVSSWFNVFAYIDFVSLYKQLSLHHTFNNT